MMQTQASIWRSPRNPLLRAVYLRQLYFSGAQSVWLALLAGACVAIAFDALLRHGYGRSGEFTLRVIADTGLGFVAPVLLGLLVTARSASAIASELAAMRTNGEIDVLRRHGISPIEYLLAPRVFGLALGTALLFVYFAGAALLTGALLNTLTHPLATLQHLLFSQDITPLRNGLLRSALFGTLIGLTAGLLGLFARPRHTEIPRAASRAVVMSLVLMFVGAAVVLL